MDPEARINMMLHYLQLLKAFQNNPNSYRLEVVDVENRITKVCDKIEAEILW